MASEIRESDWKLFRRVHEIALERFSKQVIEEINDATSNCTQDYHKRYLEIFNLIMDRNDEMARAFDDMRRSKAYILLANIKGSQLLKDEEFLEFSSETRKAAESILEIRRA